MKKREEKDMVETAMILTTYSEMLHAKIIIIQKNYNNNGYNTKIADIMHL